MSKSMQKPFDQLERGCIMNWANQLNSKANKSENQITEKATKLFQAK